MPAAVCAHRCGSTARSHVCPVRPLSSQVPTSVWARASRPGAGIAARRTCSGPTLRPPPCSRARQPPRAVVRHPARSRPRGSASRGATWRRPQPQGRRRLQRVGLCCCRATRPIRSRRLGSARGCTRRPAFTTLRPTSPSPSRTTRSTARPSAVTRSRCRPRRTARSTWRWCRGGTRMSAPRGTARTTTTARCGTIAQLSSCSGPRHSSAQSTTRMTATGTTVRILFFLI